MRRRRHAVPGQTAVEMALIFMILVNLVVGLFEASRMAAVYVSMINAAQEGARTGAVPNATDAQITTTVQQNILAFGNGLSTITPTICPDPPSFGGAGTNPATCSPLGSVTRNSGGSLVVTITYTFYFIPPVSFFLPNGLVMTTTGVTGIG